ncbi:AAA family ATPase [Planococcus sp. CPCC 101016]|uniref:ATP-binding protein n=1 Tax=Planococcus sp. CPCC 101016 TaxID=2599617 RepID=UPI0011B7ECA4|nr:ATP-binding protein [Planococcus sp. CPCC 101016]TWT05405.1 AAA family ATPase [Planococcus sp. CPCC 101016]
MAHFIMLIGLPGSGKTTYARSLLQSDKRWIHLSSDEIAQRNRLSCNSTNNQNTFEAMYQETAFHLENGNNVIYDATNLASKRRKSLLNRIEKFQPETEALVFLTPYKVLKSRNSLRQDKERVPDSVMERYIRAFQLPRKDEKFNSIRILSNPPLAGIHPAKLKEQAFSYEESEAFFRSFKETKPMTETAEMRAILQQTCKMIKEIKKEVPDTDEQELLSWVLLLHGIGKAYTRKNLPIEQDNFYGYEHVSMYLAYPVLLALEFPLRLIYDVLLLIDEYEIGKELKRGKVKRRIGLDNYERLEKLWRITG